jgi:hypothetical protein
MHGRLVPYPRKPATKNKEFKECFEMGTLSDLQGPNPRFLRGLANNKQLLMGAAIILVNMFNAKSEVNSLARVQTRGQTCVR